MRRSELTLLSLGVLGGLAWRRARRQRSSLRPAEQAPAQPSRLERGHAGAERASVLGYERASPATPDPAVGQPSGAPGHRILNG